LLEHHAVDQALAFAVPHPTLGEDLAAAVVLRRGLIVTESELRRHAFERLAPHEVPSRIVIVDELPCDEIGKPQRVSIAESLTDLLQSEGDLAIGELEHLIAAKFAELLEQDVPGRDANFFLLGGDSLSGTRVVSRLAQELSIDLNPSILFEFPTPRSLAARLNELL
jgi:acyl carrier protein